MAMTKGLRTAKGPGVTGVHTCVHNTQPVLNAQDIILRAFGLDNTAVDRRILAEVLAEHEIRNQERQRQEQRQAGIRKLLANIDAQLGAPAAPNVLLDLKQVSAAASKAETDRLHEIRNILRNRLIDESARYTEPCPILTKLK